MTQKMRASSGGLTDRSRSLAFGFNGKRYVGHPGDTLASALLANGVRLAGRSFKYHRPRGLMGAGLEESNILVRLGSGNYAEPNLKATEIELFDGLEATSVNCWPSPSLDLRAVNQMAAPLLGAGFYYKMFMWPNWHLYEGAKAAIPGQHLTGQGILHVKTGLDRAPHLEATLGLPSAGRAAMIGPVEGLWMGPGEWLLLASSEHRERLAALELHAVANGAATANAEGRLVVLQLESTMKQLSALTGLPGHALRAGRVARTRLAEIPVTIVAGLSTGFRLLFDRTFANHLRAWLDRAV